MQTHLQPFRSFVQQAVDRIQQDSDAVGLAAGGSWISGEMDAYSDLDLVLVTNRRIAPDIQQMRTYAATLGPMIASFRGDHVGEPRLLITLYNPPLLHVDLKFITPDEFQERVENPIILWERNHVLTDIMQQSVAQYPPFDFQWTEDRFWVWMHYAAVKIGRGELFEAVDFFGFIRGAVLGPMLHLKNSGLPRGVRRAETIFGAQELEQLGRTVATPDRETLLASLWEVIHYYELLRESLAPATLQRNTEAQQVVTAYVRSL
ncbi:hypothetical protein GCM10028807_13890 [Spirosoma daeguense]